MKTRQQWHFPGIIECLPFSAALEFTVGKKWSSRNRWGKYSDFKMYGADDESNVFGLFSLSGTCSVATHSLHCDPKGRLNFSTTEVALRAYYQVIIFCTFASMISGRVAQRLSVVVCMTHHAYHEYRAVSAVFCKTYADSSKHKSTRLYHFTTC